MIAYNKASLYTVAVYSWSIANNFVIDVYCRYAYKFNAKLHLVAYLITLDLIEKSDLV